MSARSAELDHKLLTHAIRHTAKFETRLCRRFPAKATPSSPLSPRSVEQSGSKDRTQSTERQPPAEDAALSTSFQHIIWRVFDAHADVFRKAHDRNLAQFVDQVRQCVHTRQ